MKPSSFKTDLAQYRGDDSLPVIVPEHSFAVDADWAGAWTIAGDIDGDGIAELVQARMWQLDDVHAVAAVSAYRLDGSLLWRWGEPADGIPALHSDAPCQIHDWNRDGRQEVVLATRERVFVLDGATGREMRSFPTPSHEAADCIVFANLTGGDEDDILLKTRYHRIWALTSAGNLVWTIEDPAGMRTAHQPYVIDINDDGFDEILAGYALLDHTGKVMWALDTSTLELGRGHLDCVRVLRRADAMEDWRLVMTCCADEALLCVDGYGQLVWEHRGRHFESIDIGCFQPESDEKHILVDIDHAVPNLSPLQIYGESGALVGEINTVYSRQHRLITWGDDPAQRFVACEERMLVSGVTGEPLAHFATPMPENAQFDQSIRNAEHVKRGAFHLLGHPANLFGHGRDDLLLTTNPGGAVWTYRNPGKPGNAGLGTGRNVTLY